MTLFGWELSVRADGFGEELGAFDQYEQIAFAADQAGFDRLVVPFDSEGDDSVILGGHLARVTRVINVDIELHPGAGSPVYLAKLFATLERATSQRIGVRLITRAGRAYELSVGEDLSPESRALRQAEFWRVLTGVWSDTATEHGEECAGWSYDGEFFQVVAGGLSGALSGLRPPRLAQQIGRAEVIEEAADVVFAALNAQELTRELDSIAVQQGTAARGLVLPVVARADADEAWDDLTFAARRAGLDDVDQLRISDLHWAGFDRLSLNAAVGLIGSYREVAAELSRLRDSYGLTEFTFSGLDPIGDLYRLAENVLHQVDDRRVPAEQAQLVKEGRR